MVLLFTVFQTIEPADQECCDFLPVLYVTVRLAGSSVLWRTQTPLCQEGG